MASTSSGGVKTGEVAPWNVNSPSCFRGNDGCGGRLPFAVSCRVLLGYGYNTAFVER